MVHLPLRSFNLKGIITRDDVLTLTKHWGLKVFHPNGYHDLLQVTKQEAADIIDAFDVDRDGKISHKDYTCLMGYEVFASV